MSRLYLNQDGSVRTPGPGEHGHLDMGRTILGPDWRGDVEETYAAMWNAGWVRVPSSTPLFDNPVFTGHELGCI